MRSTKSWKAGDSSTSAKRKFLSFVLTATLLIGISQQAEAKFKDRVRELWDARQSLSSKQLVEQWARYQRGWWGYFGQAEERRSILRLSGWIRRHIRKCFWQRWHNAAGRKAALARLGISPQRQDIAHCSRGAWRMARHAVMQEALSLKVLRRYGLVTPSELAG